MSNTPAKKGAATIIGQLDDFQGVAYLVECDPWYRGYDTAHRYVVVSVSPHPSTMEVVVLPSDEDGTVLSWQHLALVPRATEHQAGFPNHTLIYPKETPNASRNPQLLD